MKRLISRLLRARDKRRQPYVVYVTPDQFRLMFSGQGADRKYYPEKNGVRKEYIRC